MNRPIFEVDPHGPRACVNLDWYSFMPRNRICRRAKTVEDAGNLLDCLRCALRCEHGQAERVIRDWQQGRVCD